jgi:putative ABC transport system permease protein
MEIRESVQMALGSLKMHKMRSVLTTLGIIIGVTTVVGMLSLTQGLKKSVEDQVRSLGSNTFTVRKFPAIITSGKQWREYARRKNLTYEDALAIEELCRSVKIVAPDINLYPGEVIRYRGESTDRVPVWGVTETYLDVYSYFVSWGRFITPTDVEHRRQVCVLGMDVVNRLFLFEDPVGAYVRSGPHRFLVVGVLEEKGSFMGQSQDNLVMIPLTTLQKLSGEKLNVDIGVQAKGPGSWDSALDEVITLLRRRRGLAYSDPNDFEILTQDSLMEMFNNITGAAFAVVIGVASISLLVGGIGIMNIMLVTVTERTREIGIRKALGARRTDILWQFLIEATVLSGVGGILGILLGFSIGKMVGALSPLPSVVPIWSILLGLGFSSMVGLFFGIYPATKAARLDPIVALRYE